MGPGRLFRVGRRAMAVVLTVALATGLSSTPSRVSAKGQDVCPEPNDSFQQGCFIGAGSDALGFVSHPRDVDAYRFEVADYGAQVHVSLPDRPLPYRLNLTDWNGKVIASSTSGDVQANLPLPGSYYAFVDIGTDEFDDATPYRIAYSVTYPGGKPPDVLYSAEFRGGPRDTFAETGGPTSSDDIGDYAYADGRVTVKLKVSGTPDEPVGTAFYQSPDAPDYGPTVDDFTMSMDTHLVGEADAGYDAIFRFVDDDNYYQVEVGLMDQQVTLTKIVNGDLVTIVDWTDAPSIIPDGVNRTVVRAVGNDIRVNINGKEVIRAKDDTFKRGYIGYGVVTWGDPPTVNFDNMLVTTPTRR